MTTTITVSVIAGSPAVKQITLTDSDGSALDLTGATLTGEITLTRKIPPELLRLVDIPSADETPVSGICVLATEVVTVNAVDPANGVVEILFDQMLADMLRPGVFSLVVSADGVTVGMVTVVVESPTTVDIQRAC